MSDEIETHKKSGLSYQFEQNFAIQKNPFATIPGII